MLGKLIKHEFKATARCFLPAFLVVLIFSLAGSFGQLVAPKLQDLSATFYIALYAAIILAFFTLPTVVSVWRFRHNLLGDEGHLMFMLPVSAASLIRAKIIVATVWQVLSLIVSLLATSLLALGSGGALMSFWSSIKVAEPLSETILFMTLIAFGLFGSMLMYYVSLAIGQLSNKHRALATFGAIAVIYAVSHVAALVLSGLVSVPERPNLLPCVILMVCLNIGYFLLTRFLLTRKLNLV
ncbi:MAG: hypothetical protein FWD65_06170 [Coriobacteriia bacterium]|nr:hypothetical protein [Coriobacteriia bacterium]